MTSGDDVQAAIELTEKQFGQLNNVINCAGIGIARKVYNFSKHIPHGLKDFNKVLQVSNQKTVEQIKSVFGYNGKTRRF